MNTLIFIGIALAYMAADLLNYSQTGKNIGHALFAFLVIWAWARLNPRRRHSANTKWYLLVAAILFLFMGFQAFLRDYFGVEHNDGLVIDAIFNTNATESGEFFQHNRDYLIKFIGLFIVSALLFWGWLRLYARFRDQRAALNSPAKKPRLALTMAIIAPLLLVALHFNPTARRSNPLLYFPIEYQRWDKSVTSMIALQEELSATENDPALKSMHYHGDGPRTVILVIGESQTSKNYSLYGYDRDTNPALNKLGDRVLAYQDVLSAGDGTVKSMKQMLTLADQEAPELWNQSPSIITIARQAGYKVFWLSNHESSVKRNGVIGALASNADEITYTNIGGPRGEGTLDEALLPSVTEALNDTAPLKLVVVHILGGHPAYHFRYPQNFSGFENAKDTVEQQLQAAGRSPLAIHQRGEYDNAIRYSDHIQAEIIQRVKTQENDRPVAWLFAPDHGEDVAHYTNFTGHNGRVNAMWEIPLLFWSNNFNNNGITLDASRPFQTDQLPQALLGLMAINGEYYEPQEDLFSAEFVAQPRLGLKQQPYHPDP